MMKRLLVMVMALASVLSLASCGGSYNSVIDTYIDVSYHGNYDKLEELAPEAYWEWLEETADKKVKDLIDEAKDNDLAEDTMEALEEEYGKNIKISYKITDKEKLDEDDLGDIKDGLKDNYDIAKKKVTEAWELEIELEIKGKDDEDTIEMTWYVAKIDGKWYRVTENGSISVA